MSEKRKKKNMKTPQELIKELNDLKIEQHSHDWAENIPEGIWNDCFSGKFKELKRGLDPSEHRWYETSISVIELQGVIIGIGHVSKLYSESMDVRDCCVTMRFIEMEAVQTTSYVAKKV